MDQSCQTCGTVPRQKMPAAVAAALVAAQRKTKALAKEGENKHHGYRYTTAEQLIDEGRATLAEAGLALFAAGWYFAPAESRGEKSPVGRVCVTYELVHTGGESYSWEASTPVIPEKGRPEDKAEFASLTANLGYTIRGLLLIPRDDEAAIDQRDDRTYAPASGLPAGSKELEAQFVAEIQSAKSLDALPPICARVDAHVWPTAAKERIKAAHAVRKAALAAQNGGDFGAPEQPGANERGAAQLADEFVAAIQAETSLTALAEFPKRVQGLSLPDADVFRIREAYGKRKAELAGAQKSGADAAAAAARAA